MQPTGGLRVAVTGSRGVGKSTFARQLVNALLSAAPCVAFLDTDLGQPEFTPSGETTPSALPVVSELIIHLL